VPVRSLKLRLREILNDHKDYKGATQEEIAEHLGVVPNTARKYLRNEALKFERRVLERACDWLEISIGELLELVPCDFYPPGDRLLRLRSKPDDADDYGALHALQQLFGHVSLEVATAENLAEFTGQILHRNCIIVGSPHHNAAGEIALCALFGADPRDTSKENRRKLPILIEAPPEWHPQTALVQHAIQAQKAPTVCRLVVPESGEKRNGVFREMQPRAEADYYNPKLFQQTPVKRARDFGFVFVADHWVSEQEAPIRTYWMGGFSSVGTVAAMWAVHDELRRFSLDTPRDRAGEFVLAVVQGSFHKQAGSHARIWNEDREIIHLIRGSLPGDVPRRSEQGREKSLAPPTEAQSLEVPLHDKRREEFRMVVRKTWSGDISKNMPALMKFYDEELREVPQSSFQELLSSVQLKYAGIPEARRPKSLHEYLNEIKQARDGGSQGLF
jgi:transcriptional regulator with XRE-family HTH domain